MPAVHARLGQKFGSAVMQLKKRMELPSFKQRTLRYSRRQPQDNGVLRSKRIVMIEQCFLSLLHVQVELIMHYVSEISGPND